MRNSQKSNPLDIDPAENGNVFVFEIGDATVVTEELKSETIARFGDAKFYLSHFATCPAASHRKPKTQKEFS